VERLCRLILIMVISFLPAGAVLAGGLSTPVTARFENFYLDDTFVVLTEDAEVSRIFCGPIKGAVTKDIENVPLAQVLEQLARENQLFLSLKAGIVVVRPSAKPAATAYVSGRLTKLPVGDALTAVGEAYGLRLVVRGQLNGEVNDELTGTMKEVLNALAAKYSFKWTVSRDTIRVTVIQTK
jgi:hypothetical protein